MDALFPKSYEASRARFLRDVELLRPHWPSSRLEAHPLKNIPDLSIDWLWAEPHKKENLVLISIAEHGIEGYVGSAMLKLFMDEFAPRLNSENTGLLLVHAINPWGMKHHKRVNPNHVDLNRNFVFDGNFSSAINPDYDTLKNFLSPRRPIRNLGTEKLPFYANALRYIISPGRVKVKAASLLGQHRHPQGIYYGGTEWQEETIVLMELYRTALAGYQNFIQVDVHTGYGPRHQMTIIIPPLDSTSSSVAMRKFNYPLVQKIDADEFYAISGDMGEYVYRLRDAEFPNKNVFACGFEFGTFGNSLPALLRSLHISILENQLRHHGAVDPKAESKIRAEYEELFLPTEHNWREKALSDCRRAFDGVFRAHGILTN
ncbi:MAG: DUF2817 domain-containing protein [Anaerolineales bacterium]|nr:DUF2817 domain-containing protein [Anaerolineales bacterium]